MDVVVVVANNLYFLDGKSSRILISTSLCFKLSCCFCAEFAVVHYFFACTICILLLVHFLLILIATFLCFLFNCCCCVFASISLLVHCFVAFIVCLLCS